MKVTAKARVRVMLDIECESTWGHGTTISQVYDQARQDVEGFLKDSPELAKRVRLYKVEKIEGVIFREAD